MKLSWGRVRRVLQPIVLKYWLNGRSQRSLRTFVEGFELDVFPGVFHPRYFGTSTILARFIRSLELRNKLFLDVGCGAGLTALCAARAGASVTAVDINPDAVRCTAKNAARHGLSIDARVSDLFYDLAGLRFDVIAWNPPFLRGSAATPAEAAFFGGPDLEVIRRFISVGRRYLSPGASVYTILSADADIEGVERLFLDQGFTVTRALSTRWGLGETMVILCCR